MLQLSVQVLVRLLQPVWRQMLNQTQWVPYAETCGGLVVVWTLVQARSPVTVLIT